MQWWMYVLIAAAVVVLFDILFVLWLGIATRESANEVGPITHDNEH